MQIQGQYTPAGSSWYHSSAAEETAQVKTSAGVLFGFTVSNSNAAVRYLYVFDSASASSGTAIVPPIPLQALAGIGSAVQFFFPFPVSFTNGLKFAASSTNATFTASSSSDLRISALYK